MSKAIRFTSQTKRTRRVSGSFLRKAWTACDSILKSGMFMVCVCVWVCGWVAGWGVDVAFHNDASANCLIRLALAEFENTVKMFAKEGDVLKRAVAALPESHLLWFALADYYEERGETPKADAVYKRCIDAVPAPLVFILYQRFCRRTQVCIWWGVFTAITVGQS